MNRLRLAIVLATIAMTVVAVSMINQRRASRLARELSQPPITTALLVPFPAPKSAPFDPRVTRALQSVLDAVVSDYRQLQRAGFPEVPDAAPGVTAAVVSEAGTWAGAAGTGGDGVKLVPDSMMAIGSITKTFTAAEVLHLADAHKIDLDAPISRYLGKASINPRATIRQTLAMTSGLPFDDDTEPNLTIRALVDGCARAWTPKQAVRALVSGPTSTPGGRPVYSNAGYVLLGELIERVTGKPFAAALHADLLGPDRLSRVVVQDAEQVRPPVAFPPARLDLSTRSGYLPCRSLASAAFAAGAIASDAPTVARWGYDLYGSRLLPEITVAHMIAEQSVTDIDTGLGYGLGTMIFHNLQYTITDSVGHSGEILGYTSLLAVSEREHLSVAVLVDDDGKDTTSIVRGLFAALRSCQSCSLRAP